MTHTMRGMAAVGMRHFEVAASALDEYETIVERGLQVVLRDPDFAAVVTAPPRSIDPEPPYSMIVLGSTQGLCGSINRHVTQRTIAAFEGLPGRRVATLAVGTRLRVELEIAGIDPTGFVELPSTVEGITPRAEEVLLGIDRWRTQHPGLLVYLAFPAFGGRHGSYEPVVRRLVPFDPDRLRELAKRPWPTKVLPTHTVDRATLFGDLMRQALFVGLHRSFAQTMASVAASRLVAMDGARRNIDERLAALQREHHRVRQSAITEELLDVASGFEVLQA